MRKILMTAAVLTCAASIASAQTVTSANIVGYNKIATVNGDLVLAGVPFNGVSNTVSEILGDTLPMGTKVFTFNGASYDSVYYGEVKESQGGFPPTFVVVGTNWTFTGQEIADLIVPLGSGFFYNSAQDVEWVYERPFDK